MKVSQISIGRFHHFHLARQLERHGCLQAIFTGYPRWKLKDEAGIPKQKIRSFPWLQVPFMAKARFGITNRQIIREWAWLAHETLDRYAAARLEDTDVLIALSGGGLHAGRSIQRLGGRYICDRGSSHIRYQNELLHEEYQRWGFAFPGIDSRVIAKEEAEYETADRITVPSEFARRSFLAQGVAADKIMKIPYGARLDRFRPVSPPDPSKFVVLFVGQVSLQKGILYLLDAFERFSHPAKELRIVGSMSEEIESILKSRKLEDVKFLGNVPNAELAIHYSLARVFVLPSIQEGFGMVMGEAMACGCPVIATRNTGAEDLFEDGESGFIVPIRDSGAILNRLELLAQDPSLRSRMSERALDRVQQIGGWSEYGDRMVAVIG